MARKDYALLTEEQAARALGVSVSTLRRLVADGLFPPAFAVSSARRGWLRQDVEAYLHLRSRIGHWPGAPAESSGRSDGEEN